MNKTVDFYNNNAESFCRNTLSADMTQLYQPFLQMVPCGGKILDCGCGSGRDSKFFCEKGFQVTAMDASSELCRIASQYAGIPVLNMTFDEIDFQNTFDGIWACSSILHVPQDELAGIMNKLNSALKSHGVLYVSFKYGTFSGERNGRYFTDMDEDHFSALIAQTGSMKVHQLWITSDVREGRHDEYWLNAIVIKD